MTPEQRTLLAIHAQLRELFVEHLDGSVVILHHDDCFKSQVVSALALRLHELLVDARPPFESEHGICMGLSMRDGDKLSDRLEQVRLGGWIRGEMADAIVTIDFQLSPGDSSACAAANVPVLPIESSCFLGDDFDMRWGRLRAKLDSGSGWPGCRELLRRLEHSPR